MSVDMYQLRHLARSLAGWYEELEELKYSRPAPPEVRVMKPALGPQSPGNWLYVACYLDQSAKLREVAFNALGDIGVKIRDDEAGAVALCRKLAFHAQAVSELNWADDLADELESQRKILRTRCRPVGEDPAEHKPEQRLSSRTICYKLAQYGHMATPGLLRKWLERGQISSIQFRGKNFYLMSEVMDQIAKGNLK